MMRGIRKVAALLKNNIVLPPPPLVISLVKTHILFSTMVLLYAASFAVFVAAG
ncbi:hypothetical protein [Bartonella birtlesii]|uniref:hypothetical protein n=1 Tax=Bartonella birtlesii TaxID=111504 RepID=UPI0004167AB6|nr:hypothetical protein [Bartonella birtlesii]